MTIKLINGVAIEADTLDGAQLAAITAAIATAVSDEATARDAAIAAHAIAAAHRWTDEKLRKGAGPGANPDEISMPTPGIWTLLETLSPVGVETISSSALTAYDMFMVLFHIEMTDAAYLKMRLNGDSGDNYGYRTVSDTAIANALGEAQILVVEEQVNIRGGMGVLYLPGTGGASRVPIAAAIAPADTAQLALLSGRYEASVNITSFTFLSTPADMTGKFEIYGMNF